MSLRKVLAKMLGDLLDLFAQRMVGWHFGVFGGHRLSLLDPLPSHLSEFYA